MFPCDVSISGKLVDHAGSLYPQFPQERYKMYLTDARPRLPFDCLLHILLTQNAAIPFLFHAEDHKAPLQRHCNKCIKEKQHEFCNGENLSV